MKWLRMGLDLGSVTAKCAVLDGNERLLFSRYRRHYADIGGTVAALVDEAFASLGDREVAVKTCGSGGMLLNQRLAIPFIQEVSACTVVLQRSFPNTDVAVELGGEDAKITYLGDTLDQRMNGTCAGGTGAFIDQMAALLETDPAGLNTLAGQGRVVYPIASRCGVFAKTDVQSLLASGAERADVAASILQAVVHQTVSGLACGRPIRGRVIYLGGPLFFLPELRRLFTKTLALDEREVTCPEDALHFAALGAALAAGEWKTSLGELKKAVEKLAAGHESLGDRSGPLFPGGHEYREFLNRHEKNRVRSRPLAEASGDCFLGVDAGSTTFKLALIDAQGRLLDSFYGQNRGQTLETAVKALKDLYKRLPGQCRVAYSCVSGYGESLLKAAFGIDRGEVETMSLFRAGAFFAPGVEFIMDIGGQDMKCLKINQGAIADIIVNEACSSGCGTFIQSFAGSLGFDLEEFVRQGIEAAGAVDLGSRCTVFMNSRVKQAQKDGAGIGAISAGLAQAVVKNALYKVIKIRDKQDLGRSIVVCGGTFVNDAVLRSLELELGREVIRPDIARIMGAFGAALAARESYTPGRDSNLIKAEALDRFSVSTENRRCPGCTNRCLLQVHTFSNQGCFVSGNRCEKGNPQTRDEKPAADIFAYKYQRLFAYRPLRVEEAPRGRIGLPRALNIYEHYPFWFTLFTRLGFSVILSSPSTSHTGDRGLETLASESVCYPAKLCHGHIIDLVEKGVPLVFYPCLPQEIQDEPGSAPVFSCPIVASYPEVIQVNIDQLKERQIEFLHPFLPINHKKRLKKRLFEELARFSIGRAEIGRAVDEAFRELERYKQDIRDKGGEILAEMQRTGQKGIVLAGRPYHLDPEINHGIPQLIAALGLAVLSEDAVCHLAKGDISLSVVNQWVFHSRLFRAAHWAAQNPQLELVQLNSFGCGLDAVTVDQVREIMEKQGKIYTLLKIDEIKNLAAARLRLRSLVAVAGYREKQGLLPENKERAPKRLVFTPDMRDRHTILIPQMSPIHFPFLEAAFRACGYRAEVLPSVSHQDVETGLKYMNHDACYPAILLAGQILSALQSGRYDLENTSVFMAQTGGGCRATNYISFLRRALREAGLDLVPVISISTAGLEKNPGFSLSRPLIRRIFMSVAYGDVLMRVLYATRPYEKTPGSANALVEKWTAICRQAIPGGKFSRFRSHIDGIVEDFDNLPLMPRVKPRVGVVGEILVKYHPEANNRVIDLLESEGAEVVVPDLALFFQYCAYDPVANRRLLSASRRASLIGLLLIKWTETYQRPLRRALARSVRFSPPARIKDLAVKAEELLSTGNQTGEGWLLPAEMIELLETGVRNIICVQPFACLPNQVFGKGMLKGLRRMFPGANIVAVDYDPGSTEVNQVNRIKLMLARA